MKFNPHPYQDYGIGRMISDKRLGCFWEMGLGKTVITLTAVNDLKYNGALYGEDRVVVHVHDCKLEALCELVEGLNGQHALVFYKFKHDIPRIKEALRKMDKGLRIRDMDGQADAEAWNAGGVDILLAHPASTAYGLNLQAGGHHVIWFGLNWSLELYQQANARLHRQGQEHPVMIHRLMIAGSIDEDVAEALSGKRDTQEAILNALKARIEKVKGGAVA